MQNSEKKINNIEIKKVAKIIKSGGIVVFPRETVYGIGADALNEEAIKRHFFQDY